MRGLVLAVCASLLILLLMAGILAIHSLSRMHDQETAVRRALTERTQMLVGLWASVEDYRQAVDQLVKAPAARGQLAGTSLDQLTRQIDSKLQQYPSQGDSEETALVHIIEDVYHQQREFYIGIVTASPAKPVTAENKGGASREASNEEPFRNWPARLSAWNGERLQNADRTLLGQFADVQRGLTYAIGIAFGSGCCWRPWGRHTSCGSSARHALGTRTWHEADRTCRNSPRASWMRRNPNAARFRENCTTRSANRSERF